MPIAALLGVALTVLIAMSWLLNRDALREAVEAQIRAVTGLDLVVHGNIDISVFPGSYVSFHDVGLKGVDAPRDRARGGQRQPDVGIARKRNARNALRGEEAHLHAHPLKRLPDRYQGLDHAVDLRIPSISRDENAHQIA